MTTMPPMTQKAYEARLRVREGMDKLSDHVSYTCPACSGKLLIQAIERGHRIVFDMICHECGAHLTMRVKT